MVYLYRHHDGYLPYTGANLWRHLREAGQSPTALLASLLGPGVGSNDDGTYEVTTYLHGDIEHCYEIVGGADQEWRVRHSARRDWESSVESWALSGPSKTLEGFAELVNAEIRGSNAHLRAAGSSYPPVAEVAS